MYVLQREKSLQTDFDNLSDRTAKKKEKYRTVLGELRSKVKDQAEVISNYKVEISDKQRKIKEQDSELTDLHQK